MELLAFGAKKTEEFIKKLARLTKLEIIKWDEKAFNRCGQQDNE